MIRKTTSYFLLICTLAVAHTVKASEEASQLAINCGAIYFVATAAPPEALAEILDTSQDAIAGLYQQMGQLGEMMGFIFTAHRLADGAERVSTGDFLRERDSEAKRLANIYKDDFDAVTEMYIDCNEWRAVLNEYFLANPDDLNGPDAVIRKLLVNAPMPTKKYKPSQKEEIFAVALTVAGFEGFSANNNLTPTDLNEKIRKELGK
jgi:hypothetical protein